MSIWRSDECIGWDLDFDPEEMSGGEVRSYATGWSNHYPTTSGDVERPANIDTASIPVWCVPGHGDEVGDEVGPWLRVGMSTHQHDWHAPENVLDAIDASIVMDVAAVTALVESLQAWLDMPKAYPVEVAS